ncbi:hypothetical protein ACTU6U_08230 [Microbacterium sp. A196]
MGRRQPLPDEFDGAFSVRIAKARGVGRGRLRGTDLERPFHAAGWTVIEVTAPLLKRPADLARRVSAALGR